MIYIDLLTPDLRAEPCTEVDNGNGTFSYKKANGMFFSLAPDGTTLTDHATVEAWEIFKKAPTALVAERNRDGHPMVYLRPYVEVK